MYQHRFIISLFLFAFFGVSLSSLQGKPNDKLKQQVEALNQRLEQNLLQSNQHLENGEYQKAEAYTDDVLADLDILLDATMPLDKRINQLIEKEEIILNQTQKMRQKNSSTVTQPDSGFKLDDLVFNQVKNREKTKAASSITEKQLESAQKQQSQRNDQKPADSAPLINTLQEVKTFLDESATFQTAAIDNLEDRRFSSAEHKQLSAIERLKKALEKLRQDAKSKSSPQDNHQSGQKKQNQQQASDSKQPSKSQSGEQNNQNQNSQEMSQKKKMAAKEALKELNKLRKQAREEQERRKRKFGIQSGGEQYPVNKDW